MFSLRNPYLQTGLKTWPRTSDLKTVTAKSWLVIHTIDDLFLLTYGISDCPDLTSCWYLLIGVNSWLEVNEHCTSEWSGLKKPDWTMYWLDSTVVKTRPNSLTLPLCFCEGYIEWLDSDLTVLQLYRPDERLTDWLLCLPAKMADLVWQFCYVYCIRQTKIATLVVFTADLPRKTGSGATCWFI